MSEIRVSSVTTSVDVPVNPVPGINGLTTEERMQRRSETRFFTPEHPDQFQGAIIVPGFGHTVGRLGEPFIRWSHHVAEALSLSTAIAIPDIRDEEKMTHWSLLPGELFALDDALKESDCPSHVIVFSRSCDAVLQGVAAEAWMRQVLSVSLIAPIGDRDNVLGVLERTGVAVSTVVDEHGPVLEVGRRRTRVPVALAEDKPVSFQTTVDSFRERAQILREHAIPICIFVSPQDEIVNASLSKKLARASGINVVEVQAPSDFSASAHDFDAVSMQAPVIDFIRSSLIFQPREFSRLPSFDWEKKVKTVG